MDKQKKEGQYMTPDKIADIILDEIGYRGKNALEKSIMEPSFGDGVFLEHIIRRIIEASKEADRKNEEIARTVKQNVFGIEKDASLYKKARERISAVFSENGICEPDMEENLINADALYVYKKWEGKMDYVVGNPPYVRIHNISMESRDILSSFRFSGGMANLYIIFYEMGLDMLGKNGMLGFISPNSFMQNASQKDFRNYLIDSGYLASIFNFRDSRLFGDVGTYNCICILDKKKAGDGYMLYREYDMYNIVAENRYPYEELGKMKGRIWSFCSDNDEKFLQKNMEEKTKLGDIAKIQNGVASNKEDVYVIRAFEDESMKTPYMGRSSSGDFVYFRDKNKTVRKIEKGILKRGIKESGYRGKEDNTYIIFPYIKSEKPKEADWEREAEYLPISEDRLKNDYPLAYRYLLDYREELEKRSMDKGADWFLFARKQGMKHIGVPKIVFPHLVDRKHPYIDPHIAGKDTVVYSGLYTVPVMDGDTEDENSYMEKLRHILSIYRTEEFSKYCVLTGRDMSGGYIGVLSKSMKRFGIPGV